MNCSCGHDRHDHDWWGSGPCLATVPCDCQKFSAAAAPVGSKQSTEALFIGGPLSDAPVAAMLRRLGHDVRYAAPPQWPGGAAVCGEPRPPWWRPFARRRWDRTVDAAWRLHAEAATRHGALVGAR